MQTSQIIVYIVVLVFSVIIHEISHAVSALWRGDDTAQKLGRITLNPIPHLDLIGSIILPAVMLLTGSSFLFAWAKPVPINFLRLKNQKTDIPLVSLAGPLSNILLALISALIISIIIKTAILFPNLIPPASAAVIEFLDIMIRVNIILAVINLMPIPPLDGSKILTFFMPRELALKIIYLNPQICFIVLIVFLMTGILGRLIAPVIMVFQSLIYGIIRFAAS